MARVLKTVADRDSGSRGRFLGDGERAMPSVIYANLYRCI
jgi:hypothetical protein